ncbi:MinD/ParA family ATP-binding protein [Nocardia harenae]|uniref:MinD/ParA family ATP-binding protein n=1 Tax=Nocardia harenae TaxID=358707 RepID=UPI000B0D68AD|nr:MinD/ParA family protein [Nocardia harenae]
MTTNDHNPTSPPWLQSAPADAGDVDTDAGARRAQDDSPGERAEDAPESAEPASEFGGSSGFAAEPPSAERPGGFAPEQPGGFSSAGFPEGPGGADGFAPPSAPGDPSGSGQFAQPYRSGAHPVQPQNPGAGAGYGDLGPEGPNREPEQSSGPIYSWAPPPPPQQPPYQPPQQPGPPPGMLGAPGPQGYGMPPGPPPQQGPGPGPGPGFGGPGWQQGNPQPFQPQHVPAPGQPGHSVNDLNLLKRARRAPRSGWRRAVHKVSGGMINPGESSADLVYRELFDRVNQPVRGDYRIAILSLKGGVGKTTTTVGLGSTFASMRGDRVIAIDANPDLGTLAHRVPRQTRSTVRNLLEDQHITRYSDVRAHTSQAPSRLEVLASEQDPAVSEAFSEADYRKAIGILQSFYNIILTDCGTGLMHSAMAGVLDMASSLVLVTSPAIDGARSASATLDWLDHHGHSKLVERTVVVVNASRRGASTVDLDQLRRLFLDRTRAVQVVPFDDHLAEGAEIDLELVSKPTRRALLELAAMVADDFGYVAAQQYRHGPG